MLNFLRKCGEIEMFFFFFLLCKGVLCSVYSYSLVDLLEMLLTECGVYI